MIVFLVTFIIVMLAFSALLAATETAITAVSASRLYKLKEKGNKKAANALEIVKMKEKVISTMLIGNNLINTVCTSIATSIIVSFVGEEIGAILSSLSMATILIVFVEAIPKAVAVSKAESIIMLAYPTIKLFLKIFSPVNSILSVLFKLFCFVFRIKITDKIGGSEEVREAIEHQHNEGNVYKNDRDMLESILDMRDITISEIMVHRSNVITINAEISNKEIVKIALNNHYISRIPLWKDNEDNIVGVLSAKKLLQKLYEHENIEEINLSNFISEAWFVPENILAIEQLENFRKAKNYFACVVNEYGGFEGIITIADIVEEIVGKISEKDDKNSELMIRKIGHDFMIEGSTTIRDINRELGWRLNDEEANTIAGLIINKLENIPNINDCIIYQDIQFIVVGKEMNKITLVKAKLIR